MELRQLKPAGDRPGPRHCEVLRARLPAVPAACVAALRVPGIEDRFAELLRTVPKAMTEGEQNQAVRLLGELWG